MVSSWAKEKDGAKARVKDPEKDGVKAKVKDQEMERERDPELQNGIMDCLGA